MKIPYVVSTNTRKAYATSAAMATSAPEAPRKIIAEDFHWDDQVTPAPLTYFAALALSRVFERINSLHDILQKDVDMLMDLFPADIPLIYSVPLIEDEQYWKRSFETKFPTRKELGVSYWKGKFLSACLQDYLETSNPDVFIEEDAANLAKLVCPYIYDLKLNQLQMVRQPQPVLTNVDAVEDDCVYSVPKIYHHIPLEPVLVKLYNLKEISLIFGVNDLAENYLPRYFEFSHEDCESLCNGLEHLNHLNTFRINRSNLDCSKVKIILQSLVKKESIEELDFNHCKIGDYGMKALGGFIHMHNSIRRLRIANNRFKEEGVQGIAYALQMKPAAPIELLDFSLNPMSLECATMFAAAFVRCKEKPQTLIVNSCGFSGASAEKGVSGSLANTETVNSDQTIKLNNFYYEATLRKREKKSAAPYKTAVPTRLKCMGQMAGLLCLNRGLKRLDIAANDLSGEAENTLIKAIEMNRNVLIVDLRRTHISAATQAKVDELLLRNKNLIGQDREPSDEIPALYLNEPEYLIWEYNPNNPDYIPGRYPERKQEI